jgi:hypothetical protein
MKSSPKVNFINVLDSDSKSTKRQSSHQYLFALLRSPSAIAAPKMLVKFTPEMGFCRGTVVTVVVVVVLVVDVVVFFENANS